MLEQPFRAAPFSQLTPTIMNSLKSNNTSFFNFPMRLGLLVVIVFANLTLLQAHVMPFDFSFTVSDCNEVTFTITQGTPTAQQWDFGDGDVSSTLNPTHFMEQLARIMYA